MEAILEPMPVPDVGKRLEKLVKELNTNYNELASLVGMSTPDVFYKIRNGTSKPRFETLSKIKEHYPNVNMNYFFDESIEGPFLPTAPPTIPCAELRDAVEAFVSEVRPLIEGKS